MLCVVLTVAFYLLLFIYKTVFMENIAKKYGKILCFLPMALFTLWTILFFAIVKEQVETSSISNHFLWVTAMLENYTVLWVTLAIVCTISAAILLYFVVHIARLKHMPAGEKLIWIVLFPTFGAAAFIMFWFMELRGEPDYVEVYPNIV